jgi:hypothetical protein
MISEVLASVDPRPNEHALAAMTGVKLWMEQAEVVGLRLEMVPVT